MTTIKSEAIVVPKNQVPVNSTNNVPTGGKNVFPENVGNSEPTTNFQNKKLKAQELNYSEFPKANRADASQFAERSLNEVKDLARTFNADYPDEPYIVDYNEFPRPEIFQKNNYGGKDKAYTAWKNAVIEWVEDCKQDMDTKRNANMVDLGMTLDMYMSEINEKLDEGFYDMYLEEGLTREFIAETYKQLKGDINAVNVALNKEASRIRAQVKASEGNIIANDNGNTASVHAHIAGATDGINNHIEEDGVKTRNLVYDETQEIKGEVRKEGQQTRQTVTKTARETQEINDLSNAISNAINNIDRDALGLNSPHSEREIQQVEDLKNRIINSTRINHETKVELLEELKEIAIKDDFITPPDLSKVLNKMVTITL